MRNFGSAGALALYKDRQIDKIESMRVLIYQGGAQYNAMNRFSENLCEGFQELGHEAEILNLLDSSKQKNKPLQSALKRKPHLVIGFNALGAGLHAEENRKIPEFADCAYMALLLDHPAFHLKRVEVMPEDASVGVVDPTHIGYLGQINPRRASFFAPHGGIQSPDFENVDRPIDVLFLGTGMDAARERATWNLLPKMYKLLLEEAFDRFLAKPEAWETLLQDAARARQLYIPPRLLAGMILQLEIVMRAEYRRQILQKLDEAGIAVTIMGNGWEHAKFKHHQLNPSVEFYDALKLMCRAKTVLNASPQFFNGTHERVFAAMLNGAVAVTSASSYYRRHFKEGEHYLSFSLENFDETTEALRSILRTPSARADIRAEALKIALRDHTWKNRAAEIEDRFETLGVLQHVYKQ